MNNLFNPDTLKVPQAAYSHGAEVPPGSRLLYVAGQVGMDKDGNVPEDFESEADLCFGNVVRVLEAAGMTPADLVKITTYMTRPEDIAKVGAARSRHFGDHKPPATLIYVAGLAYPTYHIEVEAVAARQG